MPLTGSSNEQQQQQQDDNIETWTSSPLQSQTRSGHGSGDVPQLESVGSDEVTPRSVSHYRMSQRSLEGTSETSQNQQPGTAVEGNDALLDTPPTSTKCFNFSFCCLTGSSVHPLD